MKEKIFLFFIFFIYSIVPAIVKISGDKFFFISYIFLLAFLFLYYRKRIYLNKKDLPFLFLFIYILFYIPISVFVIHTDSLAGVALGLIMYVFPMVGYFFSKIINLKNLKNILIFIAIIHIFYAIATYGFFHYGSTIDYYINEIKKGTMAFRLSSVSGSLGLASFLIITAPLSMYNLLKKYSIYNLFTTMTIYIAMILTMQRSAWISAFLFLFLYFIYLLNKKNILIKYSNFLFIFFILAIVVLLYIPSDFIKFLLMRLSSIAGDSANPIRERSLQWLGGLYNFMSVPSGIGIGTVGQSARYLGHSEYNLVFDGDYFRILSEVGLVSLFFYSCVFIKIIFKIINLYKQNLESLTLLLIVLGLSINMIGSDTTEFYFVNFLYWLFVGYFFNDTIKVRGNGYFYINKL